MKVYVVGLGKSGLATIRWAQQHNYDIVANDIKTPNEFNPDILYQLEQTGVETSFGADPDPIHAKADLVVVSPAVPIEKALYQRVIDAGIKVTNEIELGYEECRSKIIGVTGSNGKTTTTSLIGHIVAGKYRRPFVGGNIGTPFIEQAGNLNERQPAVLELSSFQLESIIHFRPNVAVLLNYSPDHLDRHGSYESYCNAKWRICENQTSDDYFILNFDDMLVREKGLALVEKDMDERPSIIWFTTHPEAVGTVPGECWCWLENNQVYFGMNRLMNRPFFSIEGYQLNGSHNLENLLAATAAAYSFGISPDVIQRQMLTFKPVEHRCETVATINSIKYVNDSKATNVGATEKSLLSFKEPIVLIAGGKGKGAPYDSMAALIKEKCRAVVLIGEDRFIIKGALDAANFKNYVLKDDFESAVKECANLACPGDVVLLAPACASFDMFKSYEDRGKQFKEIVHKMEVSNG